MRTFSLIASSDKSTPKRRGAGRRRYFLLGDDRAETRQLIVEAFREAGIAVRSQENYLRIFPSLTDRWDCAFWDKFHIACMETETGCGRIDALKRRFGQLMTECTLEQALRNDRMINLFCRLRRIPGLKVKNLYTVDGLRKNELESLSALTGIKEMYGLTGTIVAHTPESVAIHTSIPDKYGNRLDYIFSLPCENCPAMRDTGSGTVRSQANSDFPAHADRMAEVDDTLRLYQTEMKNKVMAAWQTTNRVMLQMPTGTGKTRLFVSLIQDIRKHDLSAGILIVTHRTELVEQISRTLNNHYHLSHAIGGKSASDSPESIWICSVQQMARRMESKTFDYIIIDEAHHSLASSYQKIWHLFPSACILGVTATPYRLRKQTFRTLYSTLITSWPMRRFMDEGYLADYRFFSVSDRRAAMKKMNRLTRFGADGDYKVQDLKEVLDNDRETEFLFECYGEYVKGKRGIIYAVNREHAGRIAAYFQHKDIKAVAIDCRTRASERKRLMEEFREGQIEVLVNVELFTEGFDCPSIDFVMLARPTRSLALYLQQVGRVLRPGPLGQPVMILDCVGLHHRFGLPERKRDWQKHFSGEMPVHEDYTSRPLGETGSSGALMLAIERNRLELHPLNADWTLCKTKYGKYGLCDDKGHLAIKPEYDRITATPYEWFVGESRSAHRTMYHILSPKDGKTYTFSVLQAERNGCYAGVRDMDETGYPCRFNKDLQLIPTETISLEGVTLYRHGSGASSSLTTTLALDSVPLRFEHEKNGICYAVTPDRFWIGNNGEVYQQAPGDYELFFKRLPVGYALYDTCFNELERVDHIQFQPDHCVLYRNGHQPVAVEYLDYLCGGGV